MSCLQTLSFILSGETVERTTWQAITQLRCFDLQKVKNIYNRPKQIKRKILQNISVGLSLNNRKSGRIVR